MFATVVRRSATQAPRQFTRSVSSIITTKTEFPASASAAPASSASISTTATPRPTATFDHVRQNGKTTSSNRTYHHTASWEAGSDLLSARSPKGQQVADKMEKARLRRYKNAIDML
ncbi:unnamed protein product [Jaminaea pallidilutea]